jgi:rSAM/selenodomain-associated transferase 1
VLFRQRHLVIFARAPRLGAVKTRLARDIGGVAARAYYLATLQSTLDKLADSPPWRTWLAVAPDRFALRTRSLRLPAHIAVIGQGSGDLGTRMRHAFDALPPGPAVLIGSDIPDIAPRHIEAAFTALGRCPVVFGPAEDGGYWLVGLRRMQPMPLLFSRVRWSTDSALADTLRNMGAPTRCVLLDRLLDLDDAAALRSHRAKTAHRTGGSFYFSSASNTPSQPAGGGAARNTRMRSA